jgi:hypothetical protein
MTPVWGSTADEPHDMRMGGGLWVPKLGLDSALETIPTRLNVDGAVAPQSGRLHAIALPEKLKYGHAYSKTFIVPGSAGSGITHFWTGICDLAGEVLAVTADDTNPNGNGTFTGETQAQGSGAMRDLLEPFTPEEDLPVYLFFCVVATSMPGIMRASAGNVNIGPPFMAVQSGNEVKWNWTAPPALGEVLTQITNPGVSTGTRWYMAIG